MAVRRDAGDGSIFFDQSLGAKGLYVGVISLGYDGSGKRIRKKVSGKTKTVVKDKMREFREEQEKGIASKVGYTVGQCIKDWLENGQGDLNPSTREKNGYLALHLIKGIGARKLKDLAATEIEQVLRNLSGELATSTLRRINMVMEESIRHAQKAKMIELNVASLVDVPTGTEGRPSQSLTLAQAISVVRVAGEIPPPPVVRPGLTPQERRPWELMWAYVLLSLLSGLRTEEVRALPWEHVVRWVDDEEGWKPVSEAGWNNGEGKFAIYVWRSVRVGGDTKTDKSRRTLVQSQLVVRALRAWSSAQAAERTVAGLSLVFTTALGSELSAGSVRRWFKEITTRAGCGAEWAPRELRHSFVSILSDNGMTIEEIAELVGHSSTHTTETVYRHQIRPVVQEGAVMMDKIFGSAQVTGDRVPQGDGANRYGRVLGNTEQEGGARVMTDKFRGFVAHGAVTGHIPCKGALRDSCTRCGSYNGSNED